MIVESLVVDCRAGLIDYLLRNGDSILCSFLKHLNIKSIQTVMQSFITLSEDTNVDVVSHPCWWGNTSELVNMLIIKLQDYKFSDLVCDMLINLVEDVSSQALKLLAFLHF